MSITDELRQWIRDGKRSLLGIADRIDAEYQKAIRELNNLADASVPLPVDADGEYIRVGDVLDGYGKTIEVVEMRYGHSGWVLISREGNGYADTFAFSHHHEPTVEDVLREFFEEVGDGLHTLEAVDTRVIIAKYAAKMREVMAE